MDEFVSYQQQGNVATITLDDGKVNVLSHAMLDALERAFDRAQESRSIVVLRGREGKFSAGFDLSEMSKGPQNALKLTTKGSEMAHRILCFPTPVIGVSTGHCIAMGAFLMLACDYRISINGSFRTGLNETSIGMTMHHFGIELACYRLSASYFNRCVINAELFNPENAMRAGFYDAVATPETIDAEIAKTVDSFSKLNMGAFNGTKTKSRLAILALLKDCIDRDLDIRF
jgi:enoyl-CoA hydratase